MKKVLIITPYYPYPAEKNGGIHTLNAIIKNLPNRKADIFYYGESKNEEFKFSENINNVYHECLLKKSKLNYIFSILKGVTYTTFRFKNKSVVLNEISKNQYDEIYFDQFASIKFASYFKKNNVLINIAHDSMPMYFMRKKELSNNYLSKLYYQLQMFFSKREEKKYYSYFKKIAYLSDVDVNFEKRILPEFSEKFFESNIGIDIEKVDTAPTIKLPSKTIIFTGVMNYGPNHDAMMYFVNNIWDKIYEQDKDVNLYIVGKNPEKELIELCNSKKNIVVTGMVDNVFSYIKSSYIYISPLRFGTGKKNKVLEAIACKTPLIASKVSLEGFKNIDDYVLEANESDEWIEQVLSLIANQEYYNSIKEKMNDAINNEYSWEIITKKLVD